jgi:hypothetical protein
LPDEETLVAGSRGEMTPAQSLERKLVTLLPAGALPVSMTRYVEVAVSFVAFPVLGLVGLVVWAWDGFPGW